MKKQLLVLGLFGLLFTCSCGNSERTIRLTADNYTDYVKLDVDVNRPTLEDGTVVNLTDKKVHPDTKIKYYVRCEPKDNVKVNRIDVNVKVEMYISYYKWDSYLYMYKWVNENILCDCSDMVFNEYVTSYSFVYKKEHLTDATSRGYNLSYISGTVTVTK